MKIAIVSLAILGALIASGCTDSNYALRVLKAQGYKNVRITGYKVFSCSQDDNFSTGFEAVTANGTPVEGVVCSGLFKSATVRID